MNPFSRAPIWNLEVEAYYFDARAVTEGEHVTRSLIHSVYTYSTGKSY